MKKLNILLLSAVALGITATSCSKNDSAATSPIVGKWTISSYTISNSTGTSDPKDYNDPSCPQKNIMDIRTGNIMKEQTVGEDQSNPCGVNNYDENYTYTNNVLHVTGPDSYVADYTVISTTATKMLISRAAGGQTYTYTLTK